MGRVPRRWLALAACAVLAGCGPAGASSGGGGSAAASASSAPGASIGAFDPSATREPRDQAFEPPYGSAPPAGRVTRIERATLSDDKRTLSVEFVGGPGYLFSDPCSTEYVPWVGADGDALDVAIVEIAAPHAIWPPAPSGVSYACPLIGYTYRYDLGLAQPFTGTVVNDRAGGTFYVGAPPSLARAGVLPRGWSLRASFEREPGPPLIWVEMYGASSVPTPPPIEGPGELVLYQALGIVGEWSDVRAEKSRERGGTATTVAINGQSTQLWTDPTGGELLVAWTLAGRSLGLIGNSADMTGADLVRYADGVTIGP